MAQIDNNYHSLIKEINKNGYVYQDPNRKGIYRKEIAEHTLRHDFKDGFPAVTTKELMWRSVVGELIWILRGDDNIDFLVENKIGIWNKDAYNYYKNTGGTLSFKMWKEALTLSTKGSFGDVGRAYGPQLRNWNGEFDQLEWLIETLRNNPMATKKTVTFWNPSEKDLCALTPCHWGFEAMVEPLSVSKQQLFEKNDSEKGWGVNKNRIEYQLSLKWHQHSVDSFLGLPFNIASYGLFTYILGKVSNMKPKGITGDLSNVHIYEPHAEAIDIQLNNDVNKFGPCELEVSPEFEIATNAYNQGILTLDEYVRELKIDMFKLKDYDSYPAIKAEMLAYNK